MRGRHLSAEEQAIWARVARSARPLPGRDISFLDEIAHQHEAMLTEPSAVVQKARSISRPVSAPKAAPRTSGETLDGSWDKRIAKGDLRPDVSIDLHGETLATAHARLNRGLEAAIRHGNRVILLVTGKPAADNPRLPPTSRGVIRASVGDWLAASPFADRIAAVRNAHPRHGGSGALYIVLRRSR